MKPGDLVSFTCHTGVPFEFQTDIGIFLSARTTKWDRKGNARGRPWNEGDKVEGAQ